MSKKLSMTLAFAAALSVAQAHSQESISVLSLGGAYQEAVRKAVFEPYTAATGIGFDEQEYGGEIAKIKAMVESGNITIDVVDVSAPTLVQGCDEGIFERIDWAQIGPKEDWIQGTTSECGVGTIVYATVLAYDGAKLSEGPSTIKDLFDIEKFPGKRGMWKDPSANLEFALLADDVPADQVYEVLATPEGVERAFAKLDTIKDSLVWWEAGAQAPQLLASGEVVMTTAWNGRIYNANKEGRDFRIVWDNQILDSNFWVIPKGAKNQEASLEFIKYSIKPETLAAIAKYIPYGPVRKSAAEFVSPEDAVHLPTSPENMKVSLTLDNAFWADHGEEIRKRFTTWIAR